MNKLKLMLLCCAFLLTASGPFFAIAKQSTLYDALGGRQSVEIAIDRMVVRLHNDKHLSELFNETNDKELKRNLVDFICQLSGGGCEYEGAEMLDAHSEMFITKGEFDRFVTLFIYSMDDAKIPFTAQNKLLKLLAEMRGEVIEV